MYIPTWILIGIVVAVVYYVSRTKKHAPSNNTTFFSEQETIKKYSYRLTISFEPNWYQVLKKIHNPKNEKEWESISKKIEKVKKDHDKDLCGRRYYFTEFFDSATGLITRFQHTILPNGKQLFSILDKFGDAGYIFEADHKFDLNESEEEKNARDKFTIEIGEDFIRNEIWEKNIGGLKYDFEYEKENYLFSFPLYDVFNFKMAMGQRFEGAEENVILEWPDKIKKQFDSLGIKYEVISDFEPSIFNIEEYDKEFYQKMGKPKIASGGPDKFLSAYLSSDLAYYKVSLKLFRPDENYRISENISFVLDEKKAKK